jgi:hypothetical protein
MKEEKWVSTMSTARTRSHFLPLLMTWMIMKMILPYHQRTGMTGTQNTYSTCGCLSSSIWKITI